MNGGLWGKSGLAVICPRGDQQGGAQDPHWRAQRWLQVATQGIRDEEVLWHELLAPLTSGVEGAAKSLAKHLVAVWWWNVKVRGEGMCPPTPSTLNIGQFLTDEEVEGAWESHTGSWPTPTPCSGWASQPMDESGRQGGKP